MNISRSTFSDNEIRDIQKRLDRVMDTPQDLLKEQRKKILPMAEAVRRMVETDGWQKVVLPFLERNGNPARLFRLSIDQYQAMAPKVEAYHNLKQLIENILSFADKVEKEIVEEEESGEEPEGEVSGDDFPL